MEFYVFLFVVFLIYAFSRYFSVESLNTFINQDWNKISENIWLVSPDYVVWLMQKILPASFIIVILFVFVVIWTSMKIIKMQDKMHDDLVLPKFRDIVTETEVSEIIKNKKWLKVIEHINSTNPNDWKLAILECDIMLGEILEKMGYPQESIGEKLKAVEPSDFTNIESAWEAHKIRNSIAHEGSDFMINEREAKRVIGLYELVFREFDFI